MEIKDLLRDFTFNTSAFDLEPASVTRTDDNKIFIQTQAKDRSVILKVTSAEDVSSITSDFGIGSPGVLLAFLNQFKDDSATIIPEVEDGNIKSLEFNSDGAFAKFRTLAYKYVQKQTKIHEKTYEVQVTPSATKVNDMKNFTSIFKSSNTTKVTPYTEDGMLKFKIGSDTESYSGNVTFSSTTDTLNESYSYPIDTLIKTLDKVKTCKTISMNISARGVLQVVVDSGVCVYEFYIPSC